VRDVEPVVAAEGEEEIVPRDGGDLLRLEAEQAADPVVLVDDVVAGPEVGERLECATEPGVRSRRALAEDLRIGEQDEAKLTPDEASPGRCDGEPEFALGRQLVAGLEQSRVDPAEQVLRPQRLTAMRERDDDAVAGVREASELVLGLGETAGRDRRSLRFESMRLALRKRVELGRTVEGRRRDAGKLLGPDLADLVGAPDEVRALRDRRDEVDGHRGLLVVVGERGFRQIETPFGGRPDRDALDRIERPLREC
jgi:hypothetical protein